MTRKKAIARSLKTLLIIGGLGTLTGFVFEWMGYAVSCEAIDDPIMAGLFLQLMYMCFGLVIANRFPLPRKTDFEIEISDVEVQIVHQFSQNAENN